MKIGETVLYRDYGGVTRKARVTHVYDGGAAGDLDLTIEEESLVLNIERVPMWDGHQEHVQMWVPIDAAAES